MFNSASNKSANTVQWYQNYPENINKLNEVKTFENNRKYYIREMMYYSTSNQEKKYATLLGNETDLVISFTGLYEDFLNAEYNNNTSRMNGIDFNGTINAITTNDNQRGESQDKISRIRKTIESTG